MVRCWRRPSSSAGIGECPVHGHSPKSRGERTGHLGSDDRSTIEGNAGRRQAVPSIAADADLTSPGHAASSPARYVSGGTGLDSEARTSASDPGLAGRWCSGRHGTSRTAIHRGSRALGGPSGPTSSALLCGSGRLLCLGPSHQCAAGTGEHSECAQRLSPLVQQLPIACRKSPRDDAARRELRRCHHAGPDEIPRARNTTPAGCGSSIHIARLDRHRWQRCRLLEHRRQLCSGHSLGWDPDGMELHLSLHHRSSRPAGPGRPRGRHQDVDFP